LKKKRFWTPKIDRGRLDPKKQPLIRELFARARKRLQDEMNQGSKAPAYAYAYAYAKVKKILDRKKAGSSPPPILEAVQSWIGENQRKSLLVAAVAGFLFFFPVFPAREEQFVAKRGPASAAAPSPRHTSDPTAFAPGQEREIRGIVQRVAADGVEVRVLLPKTRVLGKWTGMGKS